MKLLVESAVSAPQKLFTTDGFKSRDTQMTLDEKPNFVGGKFRFKRAKIISGDPDNDSDSEEDDVQGTNCQQAHLMGEADRVRA